MRLIVIGETHLKEGGTLEGVAWFRYPVPATPPTRQAYYARQNGSYSMLAPSSGDPAADAAETQAFQSGQYVEVAVSGGAFPNGATVTQLEPQLQALWAAEHQGWLNRDAARLQFFGSCWDGTTWTVLSA